MQLRGKSVRLFINLEVLSLEFYLHIKPKLY